MLAPAVYFSISTAEVVSTIGASIVGPALIETAALFGIKALSQKRGTIAKIAQFALAIIACLSALCLTVTVASTVFIGLTVSIGVATVAGSAHSYLALGTAAAAGLGMLFFHRKAIRPLA